MGGQLGREPPEEFRPVESGADQPGGGSPLVKHADRLVELPHLRLVRKRVAAREHDKFLVFAYAELLPEIDVRRRRIELRAVQAWPQERAWNPLRNKFPQSIGDHRAGVGHPQERAVPHRVGEAVRQHRIEFGRRHISERFRLNPRVGGNQVPLVVLEVDEQLGRALRGPLVGNDKLPDALPGRPCVDEIGLLSVREAGGLSENVLIKSGCEPRIGDRHQGFLAAGTATTHE